MNIKPELTKEENDAYMNIVQHGSMDDMFDLGSALKVLFNGGKLNAKGRN